MGWKFTRKISRRKLLCGSGSADVTTLTKEDSVNYALFAYLFFHPPCRDSCFRLGNLVRGPAENRPEIFNTFVRREADFAGYHPDEENKVRASLPQKPGGRRGTFLRFQGNLIRRSSQISCCGNTQNRCTDSFSFTCFLTVDVVTHTFANVVSDSLDVLTLGAAVLERLRLRIGFDLKLVRVRH